MISVCIHITMILHRKTLSQSLHWIYILKQVFSISEKYLNSFSLIKIINWFQIDMNLHSTFCRSIILQFRPHIPHRNLFYKHTIIKAKPWDILDPKRNPALAFGSGEISMLLWDISRPRLYISSTLWWIITEDPDRCLLLYIDLIKRLEVWCTYAHNLHLFSGFYGIIRCCKMFMSLTGR